MSNLNDIIQCSSLQSVRQEPVAGGEVGWQAGQKHSHGHEVFSADAGFFKDEAHFPEGRDDDE
ncbi:hypothetical protein [uncultured Hymenobacter sp.]|uniref:hypothetical protein n=1 Tax=uncultured Hymenobacter sp. TaxID=170016 RepID=UPI0035CA6B30